MCLIEALNTLLSLPFPLVFSELVLVVVVLLLFIVLVLGRPAEGVSLLRASLLSLEAAVERVLRRSLCMIDCLISWLSGNRPVLLCQ